MTARVERDHIAAGVKQEKCCDGLAMSAMGAGMGSGILSPALILPPFPHRNTNVTSAVLFDLKRRLAMTCPHLDVP